jgi:hypothetical protein
VLRWPQSSLPAEPHIPAAERGGKGGSDVEAQDVVVVPEGVPAELVPLYPQYPECMVQVRQRTAGLRVLSCGGRVTQPPL